MDNWYQMFTFRRIGTAFLLFYLLLMTMMIVYVGRNPSRTNLNQLGVEPIEPARGKIVHFPKKPEQQQDTPCFYNIRPFQRPTFQQILATPAVYLINAFYSFNVANESSSEMHSEIKVLTLIEGDSPPNIPFYCLFHGLDGLTSVQGIFTPFHSDSDGNYQVYLLTCIVKQETLREEMCKVYVGLTPSLKRDYVTLALLPIEERSYPFSFALCVPPIRGVVPQNKLIEFIELNNILGADHFIFYKYEGDATTNYSNPNVDEILEYYERMGVATVHPWKLPVNADDIWHYGWKLAMHHCLLTNTWTYKYLLFSDMDEFLIPRGGINHWADMMYKIDDEKYSGYCFYSTFFPPEVGELFLTMNSLKRTLVVNSQHMKCMVRPERVIEMGNQDVIKWIREGVSTKEVNESLALIHHYKNCDRTIQRNCRDFVDDDTVIKFKKNLYNNYKSVMTYILNSNEDQS